MEKSSKFIYSAVIVVIILGGAVLYHADKNSKQKILIHGKYLDPQSVALDYTVYNSNKALNEPEKVAYDFYQYYLTNIYGKNEKFEFPDDKLNNDGIYQLDLTEHIKLLNESGFFSPQFYENEKPEFNLCNEGLKTVSVKEVNDALFGQFPEHFVKNGGCGFMRGYRWVGGMGETLDIVNVVKSEISGDMAKVTVVIGQKEDDRYSYNYSYPVVTLLKEDGQWKISDIKLSFDKPQ